MTVHKKLSFWAVVLIAAVVALFFVRKMLSRIEVKSYEVKKKDLIISVTGTSTGTVKADIEVKLTAHRAGTVAKLYIEEGSVVKSGAPIADLDPDEVQQRLKLSTASLDRMKAQQESLKTGLAAFRVEVNANMNKAKAVLDEAETRLKRYQGLTAKGFVSQSDLDAVQREFDVAKASYASALAGQEQIRAREAEIRAQDAAVEQTQRERNLAGILYDYSFIRTPVSGVVTSRPVKIGETVPLGGLVAEVVALDTLYVEAFIDEADAAKIRIGQPANVTMDAYGEKVMKGEVYMISPVVLGTKQEARTFEARVRLFDKDIVLKPGMSADVEVIVSRREHVLSVPSQAIIEKNEGRYLYLAQKGRAVLRQVKTGKFNWNYTEITEGIQEGEIVISNPDVSGLKEGVRVKVISAES
jgi:RND family efflux transporter MFP subunit